MKIVLVMDQYDNAQNGTTVSVRRLSQALRDKGHTVTILAAGQPAEHKICAEKKTIPFFQKLVESQGMSFAQPDPTLYYDAFKEADVVHFFSPFRFGQMGENHTRQMRIPSVAAFPIQPENITSTFFLEKFKFINNWIFRRFYKRFYARFNHVHCPSSMVAGQLAQNGYKCKTHVISNGVDDTFRPPETPRANDGTFRILMVGRFSREKQQDLLIRAVSLSRYKDKIQLCFAGQGPREKRYRQLGKKLPRPPVFNFYSQEDLVALMQESDLYVHTSNIEAESLACLEAMACGLVPVISDSKLSAAGQHALCEESLFPAGDAQALARRIDYWIEHPAERTAMGATYAQKQDENRVAQRADDYLAMYREATDDIRYIGVPKVWPKGARRLLVPHPDRINYVFEQGRPWQVRSFQFFSRFAARLVLPITKLFLGYKLEGKQNLRLMQGGGVSVCNHIHILDCLMLKHALLHRNAWIISLSKNFAIPMIGLWIRLFAAIALGDTLSAQRKMNGLLQRRIDEGHIIHYYPEGMLLPYYKGLRPLHPGAFGLAVETNTPVLPMVICQRKRHGIWKIKKKPPLTMCILKPEYPDPALPPKQRRIELQERVTRVMRERLEYVPPRRSLLSILRGRIGHKNEDRLA